MINRHIHAGNLQRQIDVIFIDRAVSKQHLKQFHEALADIDEALLIDSDNQSLLYMREAILRQTQLPINP